jgi:hypothetical protein
LKKGAELHFGIKQARWKSLSFNTSSTYPTFSPSPAQPNNIMQLSLFALIALAIAAPVHSGVIARLEGEIPDIVPTKVCTEERPHADS